MNNNGTSKILVGKMPDLPDQFRWPCYIHVQSGHNEDAEGTTCGFGTYNNKIIVTV